MTSRVDTEAQPLGPRPSNKRARGNAPRFDLRSELYRITGVDWTRVDGIDVQVAQTVISEVGMSMEAFPTEKHFTSWLGLNPTNETSGGKVLNRRTPKVVHRAKTAFRQAASTLIRSRSYLGAQYRRLRTRLGAPKAITAMARKLACLFYRLLKHGQVYVDKGAQYYEERYKEQQIRLLLKRAHQPGLKLVTPAPIHPCRPVWFLESAPQESRATSPGSYFFCSFPPGRLKVRGRVMDPWVHWPQISEPCRSPWKDP